MSNSHRQFKHDEGRHGAVEKNHRRKNMKSIFGEENQQFQYSAALRATKPTAFGGIANYLAQEVFTAKSDDVAFAIANRFLRNRFPAAEGYGDHQVSTERTEKLSDLMAEANKHQSCYTRCVCGALLHCHEGITYDTRKTKLETAIYNLLCEGYTKKEIMAAAEMYFPV